MLKKEFTSNRIIAIIILSVQYNLPKKVQMTSVSIMKNERKFYMKLSTLELEVLNLLETNYGISVEAISKITNKSVETIMEMMNGLIEKEVLFKGSFTIDWDKIDNEERVMARIDLKVTPKNGFGFDELAQRISEYEEVDSVYLISGTYDLSLVVKGKSMNDISKFVSGQLASLDSIQETATNFIMKKYKHDRNILVDGKKDQRLVKVTL